MAGVCLYDGYESARVNEDIGAYEQRRRRMLHRPRHRRKSFAKSDAEAGVGGN